jgi:hypothetical protein
MATQSTSGAKDLIVLAERMGIPVDEAMRQVAQVIADEHADAESAPPQPPEVPVSPALA